MVQVEREVPSNLMTASASFNEAFEPADNGRHSSLRSSVDKLLCMYSRLHYNAYKWDHDEANALARLCTRYLSRLCDKRVTSCDQVLTRYSEA